MNAAKTHTTASFQKSAKENASILASQNLAEASKPAKAEYKPVTEKAMIDAISDAGAWSKQALEMELATGLALFAANGGVSLESKRQLQAIYVQAGYKADAISSEHYKTVRRRIDASAGLYEHIGHDEIVSWIGRAKDRNAIQKIVSNLEEYNLDSIQSVFALIGKKPAAKPKANAQAIGSQKSSEAPQSSETQQPMGLPTVSLPEGSKEALPETAKIIGAAVAEGRTARGRRATDIEGAATIKTEHVSILIAPDAPREELMEISMKLLEYINTMQAKEAAIH
jgi:hypothetical protein